MLQVPSFVVEVSWLCLNSLVLVINMFAAVYSPSLPASNLLSKFSNCNDSVGFRFIQHIFYRLRLFSYVRQMRLHFSLRRPRRAISDLLRTTIPWIVCCEFRAGDSWDERRQEQSFFNTHPVNTYRPRSEKYAQKTYCRFVTSLLGPCAN